MTTQTHTPGPWIVTIPHKGYQIYRRNSSDLIATLPHRKSMPDLANARLIALAPQMLDLLRGIKDGLLSSISSAGDDGTVLLDHDMLGMLADWTTDINALLAQLDERLVEEIG